MHQVVLVRCRLGINLADTDADTPFPRFCGYELPNCEGCRHHLSKTSISDFASDPLQSKTLRGWISTLPRSHGEEYTDADPLLALLQRQGGQS